MRFAVVVWGSAPKAFLPPTLQRADTQESTEELVDL